MSSKSAAGYPKGKVRFNGCVVCHYCNNKYFVREIGNHLRYCEACIIQCLGGDETKNLEQENNKWDERTKSYQQSNHGKNQQRLCGYKK